MFSPRHLIVGLAALVLLAGAPSAHASVGIFVGHTTIDRSGYGSVTTAGLRGNLLRIPAGVASFSLDAEASTTIDRGSAPGGREWDYRSAGIYGSARTPGPIYGIARVGMARNRFAVDGDSTTRTQTGYGLGVGASVRILRLEVTANRFGSSGNLDQVTWITASLSF